MDDVLKIQQYLQNWNIHWQNYLDINTDLKTAGINCKRKSKNHYIKHGIDEKRQVEKNQPINAIIERFDNKVDTHVRSQVTIKPEYIPEKEPELGNLKTYINTENNKGYNFIIQKSMFKEII